MTLVIIYPLLAWLMMRLEFLDPGDLVISSIGAPIGLHRGPVPHGTNPFSFELRNGVLDMFLRIIYESLLTPFLVFFLLVIATNLEILSEPLDHLLRKHRQYRQDG